MKRCRTDSRRAVGQDAAAAVLVSLGVNPGRSLAIAKEIQDSGMSAAVQRIVGERAQSDVHSMERGWQHLETPRDQFLRRFSGLALHLLLAARVQFRLRQ